jgi:site-specific DNA recombinase
MASEPKPRPRCAIYTRKSSEEGLEQSFNSLEAQREACEAFIASQRHEGWRPISIRYDDGGYSGGTIDRPALKRLLSDIEARRIDTVVVYKVDRLTRALSDFAKIIEIFDAQQVSFVSVTQQFNTTTSMGRLTLNVLLSFAQFEREVTGERIRDKIAASKRKGMWMGGRVPPGYTLKGRQLVVNESEAERVREIYRQYLVLGCVSKLRVHLGETGMPTESRTSRAGLGQGGTIYSRGAIYRILQNRLYLGEIPHKGQVFAGQHKGIVGRELWDQVQNRLRINNHAHRNGLRAQAPSLLVGLVYGERGNRLTPSHTVKDGKRYRYYVSQPTQQDPDTISMRALRIPAAELENAVQAAVRAFLKSPLQISNALGLRQVKSGTVRNSEGLESLLRDISGSSPTAARSLFQALVSRIQIHQESMVILIRSQALRKFIDSNPARANRSPDSLFTLKVGVRFARRGREARLVLTDNTPGAMPARPSRPLIKAVARAHEWLDRILRGDFTNQRAIADKTGLDERYVSRILQCACLAPDIVESILDGQQPPTLIIDNLVSDLPLSWQEQRVKLGFPPR